MVTPASFRQLFRAFADASNYPDIAINNWIGIALSFLTGSAMYGNARWGSNVDYATGLFVAHHLALDRRDELTALNGGVPGEVRGPASAKSVDKVSANYDTRAVTFENEAFWNSTRYGVNLLQLAMMVGAGGIQFGTPGGPCATGPSETPAYPGGFGLWLGPEQPQ